jgi:hypothetical protein
MHRIARASVRLPAIVAVLLCGHTGARAQDPAAPTAPVDAAGKKIDEVVVRGRRMSDVRDELTKYVNEFVLEVAKPPPGRGFARFQSGVCVSVTNLQNDAAQYLVNRISQTAADVGLTPGEPGCRPQVIVIFAADGKAMASLMREGTADVLAVGSLQRHHVQSRVARRFHDVRAGGTLVARVAARQRQ